MKSYRRLQRVIVIVFVSYALLGYLSARVIRQEIFPLFSWSLFTHIPNEDQDYSLRIVRVNDEALSTPLYFEQAEDWFSDAHSITAFYAIQSLGEAVHNGDETEIASRRAFVEPLYLHEAEFVRYEVVSRTYDPLERWQNGRFTNEQRLAVFDYVRNDP